MTKDIPEKAVLRIALWLVYGGLLLALIWMDMDVYRDWFQSNLQVVSFGFAKGLACGMFARAFSEYRLKEQDGQIKRSRAAYLILVFALVAAGYTTLMASIALRKTVPMPYTILVAVLMPAFLLMIGFVQPFLRDANTEIRQREKEGARRIAERYRKQASRTALKERTTFARQYASGRRANTDDCYEVLKRDGWRCYYCGVDMYGWPSGDIHIDHFYPVSKGGVDDPYNLVVSCAVCNQSKHARLPDAKAVDQFRAYLLSHEHLSARQRVWIMAHIGCNLTTGQLAEIFGVSHRLVLDSLKAKPEMLDKNLERLCRRLVKVGKPAGIVKRNGNGVEVL